MKKALIVSTTLATTYIFPLSALALEYSSIVNLPGFDTTYTGDTSSYIVNLFTLLIGIAGVLAVIMLVIGGIQYVGGAGSPSMRSSAKERIWGALLGLVIALISYLVLNSINPDLLAENVVVPTTVATLDLSVPPDEGGTKNCIIFRVKGPPVQPYEQRCYTNPASAQKALTYVEGSQYEYVSGLDDKIVDPDDWPIAYQWVRGGDWLPGGGDYDIDVFPSDTKAECQDDLTSTISPPDEISLKGCYPVEDGQPLFSLKVEVWDINEEYTWPCVWPLCDATDPNNTQKFMGYFSPSVPGLDPFNPFVPPWPPMVEDLTNLSARDCQNKMRLIEDTQDEKFHYVLINKCAVIFPP